MTDEERLEARRFNGQLRAFAGVVSNGGLTLLAASIAAIYLRTDDGPVGLWIVVALVVIGLALLMLGHLQAEE